MKRANGSPAGLSKKTRKLNFKSTSETFKELPPNNFEKHPRSEDTVNLAKFVKLHSSSVGLTALTQLYPTLAPPPNLQPAGKSNLPGGYGLEPNLDLGSAARTS